MSNLPNPEEIIRNSSFTALDILANLKTADGLHLNDKERLLEAVKEYGRQVRDKTIERIAEEVDHKWLNEHILNFKNHKDLEI